MADDARSEPLPELIARARMGDERAFADLVAPFRVRLFSLLHRDLGHYADAEDVMQDVLFHAWRGLDRYEHRGRFGAWLFTIAYRALVDRERVARRALRLADADGAADQSSGATPDAELEAAETGALLNAAITTLPEQQRRVFLLRHTSAMTFAEIARATGEPLNTVLSHMHYAISTLRRVLKQHV
jgi:RNA polymerase sigma-70 factor (ECF subfamily)